MKENENRDPGEIFSDALLLPAESRDAFLARACGGDQALRSEVESLLAVLPQATGFFRAAVASARILDPIEGLAGREIGRQVGAYRITGFIAAGGMGSVYLGERSDESYRKRVAIKLIAPGLWTHEVLVRFQNERQVLADLEHPNIARLIDGGSTPDGMPYLVMEYVDGMAIDLYGQRHQLSVPDRLALFIQACDAVRYAHRNRVIHRDLKPSNILVDASGRVKLLDFGISKVLEPMGAQPVAAPVPTSLHAMTPRYASPEQVRREPITTSTDVYSLGVVLYELLTGAPPYSLEGRTASEIERIVTSETPSRPVSLAPRLSRDLDNITLRALSKEPERRYATVEEFASDIRRHLAGLPVRARPDTAAYRLAKFASRNKALVTTVLSVVVVLAASLSVTLYEYHQAADRARELQWLAYTNALSAAESSILANRIGEAKTRLQDAPVQLRGWEWRHLSARLDRSMRSWRAHRGGITGIAFDRRGGEFASGSMDSTVKLWNSETGDSLRRWGPLRSGVESVAMAPEGGRVAAGLSDGMVLLLPVEKGADPVVLNESGLWANVDLSPDGAFIAAGFFDGRVRIWDARLRRKIAEWKAHEGLALARYAPAGDLLVTAGSDGTTKLWSTVTYRCLRTFRGPPRRVYSLAVSADGRRIATGSMDRTAAVWDAARGALLCTFREHRATVAGLAFDPSGEFVVSSGADGSLYRWDAESGERRAEFHGHQSDVSSVAISPDGSRVITGDWGGEIRTWSPRTEDVRTLTLPAGLSQLPRSICATLDAAGTRVACATSAPSLVIFQLPGSVPQFEVRCESIRSVAFTPDGSRVLAGYESGILELREADTGRVLGRIGAHHGPIAAVSVDPRGRILASASEDSLVKLWSLPELETVRTLAGHRGVVYDVVFSPDGSRLASCGADGTVRVWDPDTGATMRVLEIHLGSVNAIGFSPDGALIASSSAHGPVEIWSVSSGKRVGELVSENGPVDALAFSRDATRVALGGPGQIVRLFDLHTRREVVRLHGHVSRVTCLQFSPEDRFLMSASYDGTVRLWDAGPKGN